MTQVELMITLAVLAASILLVWPVISGAFKIHHLRDAGKIVQEACEEARLNAAGLGRILVFRFQPESPYFLIETAPTADLDAVLDFSNPDQENQIGKLRPAEEIDWEIEGKQLPPGNYFVTVENRNDEHDAMLDELLAVEGELVAQQKPLLFYPDGTCSNATIILRSDQGSIIEITLDGTSGAVSLSEPFQTKTLNEPTL